MEFKYVTIKNTFFRDHFGLIIAFGIASAIGVANLTLAGTGVYDVRTHLGVFGVLFFMLSIISIICLLPILGIGFFGEGFEGWKGDSEAATLKAAGETLGAEYGESFSASAVRQLLGNRNPKFLATKDDGLGFPGRDWYGPVVPQEYAGGAKRLALALRSGEWKVLDMDGVSTSEIATAPELTPISDVRQGVAS